MDENITEPQAKINKTPQHAINAAKARYYDKKNEILKMAALTNITTCGRLPFKSTIIKYDLSWEDIANCLASYIHDNPAVNVDIKQKLIEDRKEIRDYHKMLHSKRNQGNRDDDFTILSKILLNAYDCDRCKTPFHGKRKNLNCDEVSGLLRFVLCTPCTIGEVQKATEILTEQIEVEKNEI
jgi:hypothetical protein